MTVSAAKTVVALLLAATASFSLAAEVKIIVPNAWGTVFKQLGPSFERDTGHKLLVTVGPTAAARKAIDSGEYFDLVVTNTPAIEEWERGGIILPASRVPVAFSGLGLGVRAGAPKPDISTVDASRNALLAAKSVSHSAESASAVAFQTLLSRLGIAEQMKPRLRPMGPGEQTKTVASGETEMIVAVVPSIVTASGLELAGLFPAELQTYTTFSAAVSTKSKEPDAARAVIKLLTSPAAGAIYKSQGLQIGTP
jgi:molybdate transport system substrate-binding protein